MTAANYKSNTPGEVVASSDLLVIKNFTSYIAYKICVLFWTFEIFSLLLDKANRNWCPVSSVLNDYYNECNAEKEIQRWRGVCVGKFLNHRIFFVVAVGCPIMRQIKVIFL